MKRNYKVAKVKKLSKTEWIIMLDDKQLKTPAGKNIILPTKPLANALCKTWQDQKQEIVALPLMRLVNTAFDGVAIDKQAVKEDIIRFAICDMLYYRATSPQTLVQQQKIMWDPWIDYMENLLGTQLEIGEGIKPIKQNKKTIAAFNFHIGNINEPLLLASMHVATSLTGSAILALAIYNGKLECNKAWQIAHIDEDFNRQQWGEDKQAQQRREKQFQEMKTACFVIKNLRDNNE